MNVMNTRKALAATFVNDKAACVANGNISGLTDLMILTDRILSGEMDVSDEINALSDDELLQELAK